MKAEKAEKRSNEFGHLAGALKKKGATPLLSITARMDSDDYGPMAVGPDNSWRKKELKRNREEVKAIEEKIKNWDAEEISRRALKSLQADLAMKKARVMESEAMLGEDDED